MALISISAKQTNQEAVTDLKIFYSSCVCLFNVHQLKKQLKNPLKCSPGHGPPSRITSSMAMSLLTDEPLVALNTIWHSETKTEFRTECEFGHAFLSFCVILFYGSCMLLRLWGRPTGLNVTLSWPLNKTDKTTDFFFFYILQPCYNLTSKNRCMKIIKDGSFTAGKHKFLSRIAFNKKQ